MFIPYTCSALEEIQSSFFFSSFPRNPNKDFYVTDLLNEIPINVLLKDRRRWHYLIQQTDSSHFSFNVNPGFSESLRSARQEEAQFVRVILRCLGFKASPSWWDGCFCTHHKRKRKILHFWVIAVTLYLSFCKYLQCAILSSVTVPDSGATGVSCVRDGGTT